MAEVTKRDLLDDLAKYLPSALMDRVGEALAARQPVCNVEGTWLWSKLMDWCRRMGAAPSSHDELFAIAKEAHALSARQPVGEPVAYIVHFADQLSRMEMTPHGLRLGIGKHPVYATPPAQAVDLGPVRACLRESIEFVNHGFGGHARRKVEEALALIDSQAVGNG